LQQERNSDDERTQQRNFVGVRIKQGKSNSLGVRTQHWNSVREYRVGSGSLNLTAEDVAVEA